MALSFEALEAGLLRVWLPGERGPWPATARASGERFATAVAQWFATAQAATVPCVTAAAPRPALAAGAAAAFEAWTAQAAGSLLAAAVARYLTGHTFILPTHTVGTSLAPVAVAPATLALVATFSDVNLSLDTRAQRIAAACTTLATSTVVLFAPPPPPPPVLIYPVSAPVV